MAIKTEEDLADAINNDEDTIEIEGDLVDKTISIKATGKVAWVIAIGAIGVAVVAVLATGGASTPASAFVATGAVATLGLPVTITAISIAVAAGGIGALNKLRKYKIVEHSNGKLILKK